MSVNTLNRFSALAGAVTTSTPPLLLSKLSTTATESGDKLLVDRPINCFRYRNYASGEHIFEYAGNIIRIIRQHVSTILSDGSELVCSINDTIAQIKRPGGYSHCASVNGYWLEGDGCRFRFQILRGKQILLSFDFGQVIEIDASGRISLLS